MEKKKVRVLAIQMESVIGDLDLNIDWATSSDFSPLILIIPIPPSPGAVAIAAIVSSINKSFTSLYKFYPFRYYKYGFCTFHDSHPPAHWIPDRNHSGHQNINF